MEVVILNFPTLKESSNIGIPLVHQDLVIGWMFSVLKMGK